MSDHFMRLIKQLVENWEAGTMTDVQAWTAIRVLAFPLTPIEKHWQTMTGNFARLANWAAVEVCSPGDISSNAIDQANDIISEVGDYMIFGNEEAE